MNAPRRTPSVSNGLRLFIVVLVLGLGPGMWLLLTWSVVADSPLGPTHPGGWSWPAYLVGTLVWAVMSGKVASLLVPPFWTRLTVEGLEYRAAFGSTFVPWSSVVAVRARGTVIEFTSLEGSTSLNLACYSSPQDVTEFLITVLPPGAAWYGGRSNFEVQQ